MVDSAGEIVGASTSQMLPSGLVQGDSYLFEITQQVCCSSGQHGFTVRVLPAHPGLLSPFVPGLITWA